MLCPAQIPAHIGLVLGFRVEKAEQRTLRPADHPFKPVPLLLAQEIVEAGLGGRRLLARQTDGFQACIVQMPFKEDGIDVLVELLEGALEGLAEEVGSPANPGGSSVLVQPPEHAEGALGKIVLPVFLFAQGRVQAGLDAVQDDVDGGRALLFLPLGFQIGQGGKAAPLALEAGNALIDAKAQVQEGLAALPGLGNHAGKEHIRGMRHGVLARMGAEQIGVKARLCRIHHQAGRQEAFGVIGIEQGNFAVRGREQFLH